MRELENAIKALKQNKANGPDNIPNEFLINANQHTKELILNIFNQIFDSEDIPESWKSGILTRIYKGKGTKGKCSNERGITLSSNLGKTFERIINNRNLQKLYYTNAQGGGRKQRSTTDHILSLEEIVNQNKTKNKPIFITFLDVKKAFDKAWLQAILCAINNRGISGKLWSLTKEINSNLTVSVKTKHGLTEKFNVEGSIRQGGLTSGTIYGAQIYIIPLEIEQNEYGLVIEQ